MRPAFAPLRPPPEPTAGPLRGRARPRGEEGGEVDAGSAAASSPGATNWKMGSRAFARPSGVVGLPGGDSDRGPSVTMGGGRGAGGGATAGAAAGAAAIGCTGCALATGRGGATCLALVSVGERGGGGGAAAAVSGVETLTRAPEVGEVGCCSERLRL